MSSASVSESNTVSDRIERSVQLAFPRSRVWTALTTVSEFRVWFGMQLEGEFRAGEAVHGRSHSPKYAHVDFEMLVEEITPETRFSYRWRPFAMDEGVDYSAEPRTLVAFTLEERDGGTLLSVVESGFDGIPASRRPLAFEMNTKGWGSQLLNIEKYLTANA